ncbi:MAG: DHHW family protein [[Eubacterium] siraeum]
MRQRKLLLPVVLGSDDLIAHIKTNAKTGRNLVVIKESYGNGLIPFFTESFDNIYVLDLRYCEVNAIKFCKQVDATDLLLQTAPIPLQAATATTSHIYEISENCRLNNVVYQQW